MNVIMRAIMGWSFGVSAGTLAFSLGWGGGPGLLLLPFVGVVMILTAGPGALVESLLLSLGTGALARRSFRRSSLVWMAMAVGIPLGLLNTHIAERLLYSVTGDNSVARFVDIPAAYVLGGCFGGAACGFGVAIALEPGAPS